MNDFQNPEFEAGDPLPERRVNPRERAEERRSMIAEQIEARGVEDPFVLAALEAVPRHAFVRPRDLSIAYDDGALPLPHGQSISQPYVVAWMTEALCIGPTSRVLEIGTGSGYQTAVLCEITTEVYTIERQPQLAASAQKRLRRLGYTRPNFSVSNGAEGWREEAPFDAILVTAAAQEVPRDLLSQLDPSGRMVIPIGPPDGPQELRVYQRLDRQRFAVAILGEVRFVPLVDDE